MSAVSSAFIAPWVWRQHVDESARELYQIWRQEKEASEPQFVIKNVRFEHDPLWNTRWHSVQSARARRGIWQGVSVLFAISAFPAALLPAASFLGVTGAAGVVVPELVVIYRKLRGLNLETGRA